MRPLIFLHLAASVCAVQSRRLRENELNYQDEDQRLRWRSEDSVFTAESSTSEMDGGRDRADVTKRAAVEFSLANRNSKINPTLSEKGDHAEDDILQSPVSKAKRLRMKSKLTLDSLKTLKQLQERVPTLAPTRTQRRRRSIEGMAELSENITVHDNATSANLDPGRRHRRQRRRRITIYIDAKGLTPGHNKTDLNTSSSSTETPRVHVLGDEASRPAVWKQSTHVDQRPYVIQHSAQGNSFQYHHGQQHSRKNTLDTSDLLSEEIVALAHELSKVQEKLSRLNDAVLQQVAGQMKAAERLESILVAQGQAAVKNGKQTRRLFKRLKQSCCQCQAGKAGRSEGTVASKRWGGRKQKQGGKEKIDPLVHASTRTVNSTGEYIYMGVKSDVTSPTNGTSAVIPTTRTIPVVTTRTTTTSLPVATRATPIANRKSTPVFKTRTKRPLTTPVTQTRTTTPPALIQNSPATTTTMSATTTMSKPPKQVVDTHEDEEPNDDDDDVDDDDADDDNSSSEEESDEDSKEKESDAGGDTSEDSDINGDDEASNGDQEGKHTDEEDSEGRTNQGSERENGDKKKETDKKEIIDFDDLLENNDTEVDRYNEHSSQKPKTETDETKRIEHKNESNSNTSDDVLHQYPQLAPNNTKEKGDVNLKPTSDQSPQSVDKTITDRNANQSQEAIDVNTINTETVESLQTVQDASNTKGISSGGEQEIFGAANRGSEFLDTGEADAQVPTTDGGYQLTHSGEHVTDATYLVIDTKGTRTLATNAQGHDIDTEYHTTSAGDHSAVVHVYTTDVHKHTTSTSGDTSHSEDQVTTSPGHQIESQDQVTTSPGLQIESQEQSEKDNKDLMHIIYDTDKEYTQTDPANDFSTPLNLIEDTNRHGSDDGGDAFSSVPANDDDFTTRLNIPSIDIEIADSRTKDKVTVQNKESNSSIEPQAHDDSFQIAIFQTSSINLQEATTEITTTSINRDYQVAETQNTTTDTNAGTGSELHKTGKEGARHDKDVSKTTASKQSKYYAIKDAPFVNGDDHNTMEDNEEKRHADEKALKEVIVAPSSTTINTGSEIITTTTSTTSSHRLRDTSSIASTSSSSASTATTSPNAMTAPATMTTPESTSTRTSPTTTTITHPLTTTATSIPTSTSTTTTPVTTTSETTTTPATTITPTTTSTTTTSQRSTTTSRSTKTTPAPTTTSPPDLTTTPETEVYLEVDLTTGHVDGEDLPGVTWVVRPTKPGNAAPVTRRRTRRSTTLEDRLCEMQGVLKFTFTPPPPTRRPQDNRGRRSAGDGSGGGGREHLLLELWFRNPKRWVFNLGDSIANNGFSGDGSVQENDCEVQGYGTTFAVYGSDRHSNVREKLLHSDGTFIFNKLTLVVSDQTILWNNHRGKAKTVKHFSLFALAGQSDSQGDVNYDVYLGLNRVIDGSYRSGSGLCRVQAKWLDEESPST